MGPRQASWWWTIALLLAPACGGDPPPSSISPFAVADSLRAERRFARAHPEYRRLRDSFAVAGDTAGWWRAQIGWSETLMRQGRADSADAAIRDAFLLAGADSSRHGWTFLQRCALGSRLGRSEQAIADCARAQDLAERLAIGELEARVHTQLGTIYSRRGLFRRSVAETERALALERRHGRTPNQLAGVLNSMGVEYAAVGRLPEAAAAYEEGLAITRRIADTSTGGYLISNLAGLRAYTGRYDQAIDLMTQSLASAVALGDTGSMVYAHNALADYYLKVNNVPAARNHLERSLALPTGYPAIYQVIALANLGEIAAAERQPDSADAVLARALPLALAGGFAYERFRILAGQTRLALGRGDPRQARRLLGVAAVVADSLGSPEADLTVLALRGSVTELEGRPGASRFFLQGVDLLESWRGRLAMGDLKLGIAEPRWAIYEGAIRTLLAEDRLADAFAVSERARARMLLEVMAERNADRRVSPEALLKQRLRERFEESTAGGDSAQVRVVGEELRVLQDSLATLERRGTRTGQPGTAIHPAPASLADIQQRLLGDSGTTLLTIFWGDSSVFGWSVTGTTIRGRRLGSSDSLQAMVEFLRRAIERPGSADWRPAAARLYRDILLPLRAGENPTLLAIVDGPLAQLPLEVLLPDVTAEPLGATHRIVYGPSATVLAELSESNARPAWERAILAVGNPQGNSASPASMAVRGTAARRPSLPYAEEEAGALAGLYRAAGADLLTGRSGTVDRWLGLRPERYRYLHFATHASVNDREPDQSHLVMANGLLDPPAIRRLQLTAELVTLSACETALGRRVRGEGVVGLSHAFLSAGARSVLVSLWPVTDRSTLRFMTELYRRLHAGQDPAEALREVRRQWIRTAGLDGHPAAWAPFVLVGDPTPPGL